MKMIFQGVICVLIALALLNLATGLRAQNAVSNEPREPEMTPSLNLGKMNYEAYCASCHGKTAAGTDKGPTFISKIYHPGHHSDGAFFIAAKRGVRAHHWRFGNMPPVKGVSDTQVQSILLYVRAVQQANGVL
ncbi:MAG: cytochrome c [Rhodospirillales bacterium]|nr:cytochrome c [Rhodospirillales bacterium]